MKNFKSICFGFLVLSLLFSIGYAQIDAINLTIEGEASLPEQQGLVISNVTLSGTSFAIPANQVINTYYQTMLHTTIQLSQDNSSSVTYTITLDNRSQNSKVFTGVTTDPLFYSNNDITYTLFGLAVDDEIASGDTLTFTLKFQYANSTPASAGLDSILNFNFEPVADENDFEVNGICVFSGQGYDITGDCVDPNDHVDFINKGFSLFSQDNATRDFELEIELGSVADGRFVNGKVDTIFSNMNEDNNLFSGIVFRIENKKWYFQAGSGTNKLKIYFDKGSFTKFKVIRDNEKIFYQLDDNEPVFAVDMTGFSDYFTAPLTFGTAVYPNGSPLTERFFVGELTRLYFSFQDENLQMRDYETVDQEIIAFMNEPLTEVFSSTAPHTYDGTANTAFHTNVALFSLANYQKSFVATFQIDYYVPTENVAQATFFNAKDEANSPAYPGIMARRNGTNIDIA